MSTIGTYQSDIIINVSYKQKFLETILIDILPADRISHVTVKRKIRTLVIDMLLTMRCCLLFIISA